MTVWFIVDIYLLMAVIGTTYGVLFLRLLVKRRLPARVRSIASTGLMVTGGVNALVHKRHI